jgi:hypothetical protein
MIDRLPSANHADDDSAPLAELWEVVPEAPFPRGDGGSVVASVPANKLYFGDNLDVLREKIKDESVDLVSLLRLPTTASQ